MSPSRTERSEWRLSRSTKKWKNQLPGTEKTTHGWLLEECFIFGMIVYGKSQLDHMTCLCTISIVVSIVSWAIEGHSAQGREMTSITLSTLSINPTERGRPRPGKPGFVGTSMHVTYTPFFFCNPFKRVPADCDSCANLPCICPHCRSFWTQVTLSPSRQFCG